MSLALTDHLDLASSISLSDEPLHVYCPINIAALSFLCIRVLLYRHYEKLHKCLWKTPGFFLSSSLLLLLLFIKAACLDVFAFSRVYQAKHLVNKGIGLPVGMHKSAIPQTSRVTTVLQQREKRGGQNGISLCVPPLFSRLESLPPKHVYHGSQTDKTDTFICLNLHPALPSFQPTSIYLCIYFTCFKTVVRCSRVQQIIVHQLVQSAFSL